jgi:soluble lytic murein transglycosylase-like protein
MQLMPATAKRFGVHNRFDSATNIEGGIRYLGWLSDRFQGDRVLATAAYFTGE